MRKQRKTVLCLGAGQLGMKLFEAARIKLAQPDFPLKLTLVAWGQSRNEPAMRAAHRRIIAPFDDYSQLDQFDPTNTVVTLEFENVPIGLLKEIERRGFILRPSSKALEIGQDRWLEKRFFQGLGAATTMTYSVMDAATLFVAAANTGFPAILKTRRDGYDGKGQVVVKTVSELEQAWKELGGCPCVLEERVDLDYEFSIIVAQDAFENRSAYRAIRNTHMDGILRTSYCSPAFDPETEREGVQIAMRALTELDYVGVLAVEFFKTTVGRVLVNEMAPRTHNSGHGTIEACETSQFEQQLLAICGLPLGPPTLKHRFIMENVIGEKMDDQVFPSGAHIHDYDKREARPGRKMGHFTVLLPL